MSKHKPISWLEYWERGDLVYVSDRHRVAHCRRAAQDILSLEIIPNSTILDYGCGDALEARLVIERAALLYLYDAASAVRDRLKPRFATEPRIAVLDGLDTLPNNSIDLIVVNGVLQYMPVSEFTALLPRWRTLLKPEGRLVLADVIPPGNTIATDTFNLLDFAWREGFLLEALVGLVAIFLSDYPQLRRDLSLTVFSEDVMLRLLSTAGFAPQRRQSNLGFNQRRMTYIAARGPG